MGSSHGRGLDPCDHSTPQVGHFFLGRTWVSVLRAALALPVDDTEDSRLDCQGRVELEGRGHLGTWLLGRAYCHPLVLGLCVPQEFIFGHFLMSYHLPITNLRCI